MEKCCNTLESLRIEPRRNLGEGELPASPRRSAIAAMLMADHLPRHAGRTRPDQLALRLLDPEHPVERLLEPRDGGGRRPDMHRLGFHEGNLATRPHDLRPGVEIALHLHRRQLAQGAERLIEMIGDAVGGPDAVSHGVPPLPWGAGRRASRPTAGPVRARAMS